jgi:adenosylcobinamide kinase/adenosylcobinamide-phosphate guanylyltransferase
MRWLKTQRDEPTMSTVSKIKTKSSTMLVLGGARSGKSTFAEKHVLESGLSPYYIATSQAWDDEMRARINTHKERRSSIWTNIEAPDDLETALTAADDESHIILVDCLTLWVTNLMMAKADIAARSESLCAVLQDMKAPVVLVSNEVGLGIVPENDMARAFRDHAGRLHQEIAAMADEVYFIAAGLPLKMKG